MDLSELQAKRNEWFARIDGALEQGQITRYEARLSEALVEEEYPYQVGEEGEGSYALPAEPKDHIACRFLEA